MIYPDTSFLCSLYGWDANTSIAARLYSEDRRRPLLFTPWQRFEFRNTMRLTARKLRTARLAVPFQVGNVLKRIDEDIASGRLRHEEPDWRETFRLAEELSDEHTETVGGAAVDLWHIATALRLRADTFWTFDEEQRGLAIAVRKFRSVPDPVRGQ